VIRIPLSHRKKKNVVVLGAGPAGLLAAHAANSRGHDVTVLSAPDLSGKPKRSELHGCQYLHRSIPEITYSVDGELVDYQLDGPTDGYRRKVYGDGYTGPVSPDEFGPEERHYAWDLRTAYNKLWNIWRPSIFPFEATPGNVVGLKEDKNNIILCTIPAPALCQDMENHKFPSREVWAMGSTDPHHARLRALPYRAPDMTVQCNGWRDTGWYRAATVFGYSTLEWPGGKKPPISGVARVSKPLSTDCTCNVNVGNAARWYRLGRFGQWRKGVLVHQAYFETIEVLR
jgi:hypothetical protein